MNPATLNPPVTAPFTRNSDGGGFYMIEPLGDFLNQGGQVIQRIDEAAANSITDRFNADASQPSFAGMPLSYDHLSQFETQPTISPGWLMRLEARGDGIYGLIRWTASGQESIDGGDYRFFSTEYMPGDFETVMAGPPDVMRPTRLAGLALTNLPNNNGGKPITNCQRPGQPVLNAVVRNRIEQAGRVKNRAEELQRRGLHRDSAWAKAAHEIEILANRGGLPTNESTPDESGPVRNRMQQAGWVRNRSEVLQGRGRNQATAWAQATGESEALTNRGVEFTPDEVAKARDHWIHDSEQPKFSKLWRNAGVGVRTDFNEAASRIRRENPNIDSLQVWEMVRAENPSAWRYYVGCFGMEPLY